MICYIDLWISMVLDVPDSSTKTRSNAEGRSHPAPGEAFGRCHAGTPGDFKPQNIGNYHSMAILPYIRAI